MTLFTPSMNVLICNDCGHVSECGELMSFNSWTPLRAILALMAHALNVPLTILKRFQLTKVMIFLFETY